MWLFNYIIMKTLEQVLKDLEKLSGIDLFVIDLFCGAGGLSEGVEQASVNGEKCAKVVVCINHDRNAILSHNANMPDALHFIEDIRTIELSPRMCVFVSRWLVRTLKPMGSSTVSLTVVPLWDGLQPMTNRETST